jgi:hypothetical protein
MNTSPFTQSPFPCPACGEPFGNEPVTSFHQNQPDGTQRVTITVHTRCEQTLTNCQGCSRAFGDDERRVCKGLHCWHLQCVPPEGVR